MQLSSLQKGLVLYLPLDEQSFNPATKRFTDKSAYSNHGTGNGTQLGSATPGFQADRMGQLVRAAPFNGSDDYIDCGNDSSLDIGTSDFSIVFNIKKSINTTMGIIGKWASGVSIGYIARIGSDNKLRLIMSSTGTTNIDYTEHNFVLQNGVNYRVVLIVDRDGWKYFYVDGVRGSGKFQNSETGSINNALSQLIGKYSGSVHFNGTIDEVRIYNRVLSDQEITLLYESYRPKVIA